MDIINAIRNAGVVGAGGAGFPTHVKLNVSGAECIIANGAECEPLLYVDQLVMEYRAQQVIEGLSLAMQSTGAKYGVIATKRHYAAAVHSLRQALLGKPNIQLHLLESYYPSGDEKSLIYEVLGRVVPTGKLPIHVGCVVINVSTALGIANAVQGIPVTERTITIGGDVPSPFSITVPLGTPYRQALALGNFTGNQDTHALLVGGPCMGTLAENWDAPITKTCSGLLPFPRLHPLILRHTAPSRQQALLARSICCQCNRCTQLCPRHSMGLACQPHKAMRAFATGNADLLGEAAGVLSCSGCGLCTYFSCEMGLDPAGIMRTLKETLSKAGVLPQPEENIFAEPHLALKNIPTQRLIARMGLSIYDRTAPLNHLILHSKRVVLPLRQHVGSPSRPLVQQGDVVHKGQMIADIPSNALGATLHASLSGQVMNVSDHAIVLEAST